MPKNNPTGNFPDKMPGDLREQKALDLVATIENFCNESQLSRIEIVGALEGVKHSLLRAWFDTDQEEQERGY